MKLHKTVCPNCRKKLNIPPQKEKIHCPECGKIFKPQHSTKDLTPSQVLDQAESHFVNLFEKKTEKVEGKEFGRYRIIEEIGSGGMGKVYKAYDSQLKRMVALKLMLSGENAKKTETLRFLREAQATARLQHPNIVMVLDIGQQEGKHFFAMELIEGVSLKELLQNTSLSVRRKIAIFKKIAQAVGHAHKQGVIHRDLKPSNVMMDKDQNPKVMDFGLAKVRKASQKLSQSGMIIGTLQYMPPEQAEGKIREIDERSDVYSLGAILYEVLTGVPPFQGDTLSGILYQVLNKEPLPLRKIKNRIPKNLDFICLKALEKKKAKRYQNVLALIEDLTSFEQGKKVKAQSFQWSHIVWHKAIFFLLMILLSFFAYYKGQLKEEEGNPNLATQREKETLDQETPEVTQREKETLDQETPSLVKREIKGFRYIETNKYFCGGEENEVDEYQHMKTGIEFVLIASSSFMMGSNDGESNEKPVHRVNVPEFLMSKYEVTQGQWRKIMGTSPWSGEIYVKEGPDYAASCVSWNDAKDFCQKTGLRLPSEAEWEYSCRAGNTSRYYWGNNIDGDYAWWNDNANEVGEKYAHKVGQKRPNSFGLYDISGNVWEWCEDSYKDSYSDAPANGSAWTDNGGSKRINRGGGWSVSDASNLGSAYRYRGLPNRRIYNLGFRVSYSRLEREIAQKVMWEKELEKMSIRYIKIREETNSRENQLAQWKNFLRDYQKPIPTSTEDEKIRSWVNSEVNRLEEEIVKRTQWKNKLQKMEEDYKKLTQRGEVEEVKAFLKKYQENNPYSEQDETILRNARTYLQKLEEGEKPEKGEITGFIYLGKNTYSAGGQSHTVKEYRHDKTGIEFVLVPGGSFMMGSNDGESEKPIQKVSVKEFLISKYEVTQGQWQKIMGDNPSDFKGANKPVERVTWDVVKKFCSKTGLRLPSEAEWEYACRAGTKSKYYWGDSIDKNYVDFESVKTTINIGSKKPNAFGLYDMSGNVWEWCEDRWHDNYSGAPRNGSAWTDNGDLKRVVRGGSWGSSVASFLGSAFRVGYSHTEHKDLDLGFRVSFSP